MQNDHWLVCPAEISTYIVLKHIFWLISRVFHWNLIGVCAWGVGQWWVNIGDGLVTFEATSQCRTTSMMTKIYNINSLAPGRFEQNFRSLIFKLISVNDGWGIPCKIALRWMPLDLTDDKSTLVQVMAWCCQATSHYLSQCWPWLMSPYGITRPQWVNNIRPQLEQLECLHSENTPAIPWLPILSMSDSFHSKSKLGLQIHDSNKIRNLCQRLH